KKRTQPHMYLHLKLRLQRPSSHCHHRCSDKIYSAIICSDRVRAASSQHPTQKTHKAAATHARNTTAVVAPTLTLGAAP
ncbi:Hypothetical predicted protein, partial [Olea europaea subsp. europaea]